MRGAITGIFFLNGVVFTSWYARLPAIQTDLELGPGVLGFALLGAPLGALAAQPLAGALAARRGSWPVVAAAPLCLSSIILPALAVGAPTLFVAVLVVGVCTGILDLAMNAQGVVVERAVGRRIFSSLHAAFSFGALAGAGVAALAAGLGIAPLPHLAAMAGIGALAALALTPRLIRDRGVPGAPAMARPSRRLVALGVIAFCALLAEGAVLDWSGIYMASEVGASAGVAPLALAGFSLTMAFGRLGADPIAAASGTEWTARVGATLAALGLALALAVPQPVPAIAGYALMGAGLAAVFPLTLQVAGGIETTPGPQLAAISTFGYTGFLLGPPMIGLLAEGLGLRWALLSVCGLCLLAATLAHHARE